MFDQIWSSMYKQLCQNKTQALFWAWSVKSLSKTSGKKAPPSFELGWQDLTGKVWRKNKFINQSYKVAI